jgi:hypothetical protein
MRSLAFELNLKQKDNLGKRCLSEYRIRLAYQMLLKSSIKHFTLIYDEFWFFEIEFKTEVVEYELGF